MRGVFDTLKADDCNHWSIACWRKEWPRMALFVECSAIQKILWWENYKMIWECVPRTLLPKSYFELRGISVRLTDLKTFSLAVVSSRSYSCIKTSAERPRARKFVGEHGGFGQTGTSLCIFLEGVHLLQHKVLGVTCWSQQGDSGTLCASSHGSYSSTECHLLCGTYFGLELVGRLLWRVQTLHCSVFFAANVCHGPMLLLLYFPPDYVATLVVNSTWMVQQLCYGHGNLDGFFHAADFPLLLFAPFGRSSSRWMAGIYHFSFECHWELCTEAWGILAMVILTLPQPFFVGYGEHSHSLTPQ